MVIDRRSVFAGAAIVAGTGSLRAAAQPLRVAGPSSDLAEQPPTFVTLAPTGGTLRAHVAPDAGGEMAGLEYVIGGKPVELLYRGMDFSPTRDWTGKAPILWPAVGSNHIPVPGDAKPFAGWISNGQRFPMPGHGFVRDKKWRLEDHRNGEHIASATVSTVDGPETRQVLSVRIQVQYRVQGGRYIGHPAAQDQRL